MTHVKDILGGLAIFIVVAGIIGGVLGGMIYAGHMNAKKEQTMTRYCVDKGYRGWDDSTGSRNSMGASSCIRD